MLISQNRLGRWILPNIQQHFLHQWTYSLSEEKIYQIQNISIFRHLASVLNHNTISMNSASEEKSDLILDDVIPINKLENEYIRYRNTCNFKSKPKLTSMTLKSYTTGQDKWKQLLLSKYKEYLTDKSLAAAPQSKEKLIIVCLVILVCNDITLICML